MNRLNKPTPMFFPLARLCGLALPVLFLADVANAQTVSFSTVAAGVTKSIPYWGYDTAWHDMDNMRRSVLFMGNDHVNLVRVGAGMNSPLVGGYSAQREGVSGKSRKRDQELVPERAVVFCLRGIQ